MDVTKNPKLNALYCSDNQLEELDLSQNSNIGQGEGYINAGNHLWCDNNRLRVLNMDNITRDAYPKLQNQKYSVNLSVVDNNYVGVKINFNKGNSTGETDFAKRFKRSSYDSPSVTMDGKKIDVLYIYILHCKSSIITFYVYTFIIEFSNCIEFILQ